MRTSRIGWVGSMAVMLLAAGMALPTFAEGTAYTWTNDVGDLLWRTEANWNPNGIPGDNTNDTVTLPDASGRTITIAEGNPISIDQLTVSGAGGTLQVDSGASFTAGRCSGNNFTVTIAAGALFTLGSAQASDVPRFSGSGQFVKVGTGTASVGRDIIGATWTGTIDVQEGILSSPEWGGWTHMSMLTVRNGAQFFASPPTWHPNQMGRGFTLHGEGVSGEGAFKFTPTFGWTDASLTIPSASTINISNAAGEFTFYGLVSGAGALTKIGPGTLVLGTGSLGGVEITAGTLQVTGILTSDVHIAAGAKLIAGEAQIIGTVTWDEGGIWDNTVFASWVGPAGDPNGSGVWHEPSHWSAGVLPAVATLPAPPPAGRTITIAEGNPISIDRLIVPTSGGTLRVDPGASFTVGRCDSQTYTVNIAENGLFTLGSDQNSKLPPLSGSGKFVKVGTGTADVGQLTIGATWTGTMDVQQGILDVSAWGGWTHASMCTVSNGAMLSGSQPAHEANHYGRGLTLHGEGVGGQGAFRFTAANQGWSEASLTIASDSTINISNAAGVFTFRGPVSGDGILTKIGAGTLALSNTWEFAINGATGNGIVVSNGTVNIANCTLSVTGLETASASEYVLVDYFAVNGHVAGSFANIIGLPETWSITYEGTTANPSAIVLSPPPRGTLILLR